MSTLSFGREPGGRARISDSGMQKLGNRPIVIECAPCRQSAVLRHLWCTSGGGLKDFAPYRAAAASLPAKITARQPQSRQFLKSTSGIARYFICAGAKAQAPASSAGVATMLRRKTCATPKLEGDPMKIITSLLAATLLLAGINLATAQTGCSDCQPLPTNPPSTSEGGMPPGGYGR